MDEFPLEIERKFLIKMPDANTLERLPGCRVKRIEQTYLISSDGKTARVRKSVEGDRCVYTKTEKTRITDLKCIEIENEISAEEYERELSFADPSRKTVKKTRYCIPCGALRAEIDVYPFWDDRAIAEFELESEDTVIDIPDYISVIREVTNEYEYKNSQIALKIPE